MRALAAPLANIDKITIVSTGNGDSAGMNKITGDITKMAAQIPALFETLSGMQMSDLLGKVRTIGDKAPKPGNGSGTRRQYLRRYIMALLERVATLVRANLNDLIDKAEDPEKMIKQVILDMQNQLLQVKTQVAIAIADQHLLEKKQKENQEKSADWIRKAELAVDKQDDELARAAIERSISYRSLAGNFADQVADQSVQVENLKSALRKLEQKLAEAQAKSDVLIAQHRRARALNKAGDARMAIGNASSGEAFDRMKGKVQRSEALSQAKAELTGDSIEDRLASLEKQEEVTRLLAELKAKRGA